MANKRLQIPLSDDQLKLIDEMVQRGDFRNRTTMFDEALCLLEWAMKEAEEGREIGSFSRESPIVNTYEIPVLTRIKRKK